MFLTSTRFERYQLRKGEQQFSGTPGWLSVVVHKSEIGERSRTHEAALIRREQQLSSVHVGTNLTATRETAANFGQVAGLLYCAKMEA